MSDLNSIKRQLQNLINLSNKTTGNSDTNLTDGVGTLIDGYGDGPIGIHAYYNGVILPVIPEEILKTYPYAWIRNNKTSSRYELILSTAPFYYSPNAPDTPNVPNVTLENWQTLEQPLYTVSYNVTNTEVTWSFVKTYTNTFWNVDSNRQAMWSNHDLRNGSVNASDIYLTGSEFIPI